MTEKEQLDAIESLTRLIYEAKCIGPKRWEKLSHDEIADLVSSVMSMLRSCYRADVLKGRLIHAEVIKRDWDSVSDDERKACIDASIAAREIIEAEERQEEEEDDD